MIGSALKQNGVPSVSLNSTDKKLRQDAARAFLEVAANRVLLINVKTGAAGLTLVNARHVFLMEPLLNPSMEVQAVNRVHRIGQERETFVYKFFVRHSVEEKIMRLVDQKAKESEDSSRKKEDEKEMLRFDELQFILSA